MLLLAFRRESFTCVRDAAGVMTGPIVGRVLLGSDQVVPNHVLLSWKKLGLTSGDGYCCLYVSWQCEQHFGRKVSVACG